MFSFFGVLIFCGLQKARVLSGSPQSTLIQVGSWSGQSTMSSNGSPNGPSQVSSPPTTPLGVNNDAWDLIYQAAGQVARLKMNGGVDGPTRNPGLLGPPKRLPTPPLRNSSTLSTFYHNQVSFILILAFFLNFLLICFNWKLISFTVVFTGIVEARGEWDGEQAG